MKSESPELQSGLYTCTTQIDDILRACFQRWSVDRMRVLQAHCDDFDTISMEPTFEDYL